MTAAAVVLRVYGLLWGATSVGVLAGSLLGGARPGQLTRRPGGALFVDALATNARLVGAIALAALLVVAVPGWRRTLDAVVAGLLATNTLAIGAALGATEPHVLLWLAHVPVEWAAFAVAAALYLHVRRDAIAVRVVARWAFAALGLVAVAAGIEAWGPRVG